MRRNGRAGVTRGVPVEDGGIRVPRRGGGEVVAEGLEGLGEFGGIEGEACVILDDAQGLPGAVEICVEDAERGGCWVGAGGHREALKAHAWKTLRPITTPC